MSGRLGQRLRPRRALSVSGAVRSRRTRKDETFSAELLLGVAGRVVAGRRRTGLAVVISQLGAVVSR